MKKRLLYGVLNWGLGHATRSTVLIRAMEEQGFDLTLASDGEALAWLKREFPGRECLELPAYDIRYSEGEDLLFTLIRQLPRLSATIEAEANVLKKHLKAHPGRYNGLISDNRLGFYHASLPAVYISHQFNLKAGFLSPLARWLHRFYWARFDELWLPDTAEQQLSGSLSALPAKFKCRYLGPLSRFRGEVHSGGDYYLGIVSGPPPQNQIFQDLLLAQAPDIGAPLYLASPLEPPAELPPAVKFFHSPDSAQLETLIKKARAVISRSGYSSIMDYGVMGARALLVPTPGQYEQQYLAQFHDEQGHYAAMQQSKLDLAVGLIAAQRTGPLKIQAALPGDFLSLFEGERKG